MSTPSAGQTRTRTRIPKYEGATRRKTTGHTTSGQAMRNGTRSAPIARVPWIEVEIPQDSARDVQAVVSATLTAPTPLTLLTARRHGIPQRRSCQHVRADAEPQSVGVRRRPPVAVEADSELRRLEKGGEERAAARSAFVAQMARRRSSVSIEAAVKTDSAGGASSPTDAPVQRRRSAAGGARGDERARAERQDRQAHRGGAARQAPRRHLRALAALLGKVAWFRRRPAS